MKDQTTIEDRAIKGEEPSDLKMRPPLQLDEDEYRADLAEFDLSEDQQNELLQALWNIMSMCVDIGWGVDTVRLVCPELFEKVASSSTTLSQIPNNDNTRDTDETQRKAGGN